MCPLHICLAWRGRRAVLITWLIVFEGCFLTLPHLSQASGAFPVLRNLWNSVCRFPSASGVLSLKSLWCDCTSFSNYFLPPSSNWWQFRSWNNFRFITLQAFLNNPSVPSTRSSPLCLLRRLLSSQWHPRPYPLSLLQIVPLLLLLAARPCPSFYNSCCVLSSTSAKWFVHLMFPSAYAVLCAVTLQPPLGRLLCLSVADGPRAARCWSVPFGFPSGFSSSESTVHPLAVCLVTQSCLTLCDPMGWSPPGSSCPWGSSRQKYQSGLPWLSPGDLPNPGIKPRFSTLQADYLPSEPEGSPYIPLNVSNIVSLSHTCLKVGSLWKKENLDYFYCSKARDVHVHNANTDSGYFPYLFNVYIK